MTHEMIPDLPDEAFLAIKTVEDGWVFIHEATKGNIDQSYFEGICQVIFRRLVAAILLEHNQTRVAEYLKAVPNEEFRRLIEDVIKKAGRKDDISIAVQAILDAFSHNRVREKFLAFSACQADKAEKVTRAQQKEKAPRLNRLRLSYR